MHAPKQASCWLSCINLSLFFCPCGTLGIFFISVEYFGIFFLCLGSSCIKVFTTAHFSLCICAPSPKKTNKNTHAHKIKYTSSNEVTCVGYIFRPVGLALKSGIINVQNTKYYSGMACSTWHVEEQVPPILPCVELKIT